MLRRKPVIFQMATLGVPVLQHHDIVRIGLDILLNILGELLFAPHAIQARLAHALRRGPLVAEHLDTLVEALDRRFVILAAVMRDTSAVVRQKEEEA